MLELLADVQSAAGLPAAALPYALAARVHAQQSNADLLARNLTYPTLQSQSHPLALALTEGKR